MTREVRVDGRLMRIDFESTERGVVFTEPDSLPRVASILETEPGIYSVILEGHSYRVFITRDDNGRATVTIRGYEYIVDVVDPRAYPKSAGAVGLTGEHTITALMPGKIVRVLVKEGDCVEAGQGLLVVEAMKMQNEMKSVSPGKVKRVLVEVSATVGAGQALAIIAAE